ncbi:MAG: phosphoglycerate mutase [Deltaproteobacteria bacterium]|nr:phosphoglycerate mutase [Candidatus Anaeroferrophillacea bacterium]
MTDKRLILLLLDGLGDRSFPELGGRTPLQAAATPALDRLAALGANGLFHAVRPGLALPSELAHFLIFGYPAEWFPGRGPLEALGAGIDLPAGAVAVLAHLAGVERDGGMLRIVESRPATTPAEAAALMAAVEWFPPSADVATESSGFKPGSGWDPDPGSGPYSGIETPCAVTLRLVPTRGIDGILVLEGAVSPAVSDSDPLQVGAPVLEVQPCIRAAAGVPGSRAGREVDPGVAADGVKSGVEDALAARCTAQLLNRYLLHCHRELDRHPLNRRRRERGQVPLNALVCQRAGRLEPVPPFAARWGLRGLTIASGFMYHGLGHFLGMAVAPCRDTDDPGTDLAARLRSAMDRLDDYDLIHVHTKAPDVAAHTKDPRAKVRAIESLDCGLASMLDDLLAREDCFLAVTADHSTPSGGPLIHSGEPVPLGVVGPGIRCDDITRFDEIAAAGGALGQVTGADFMYLTLNWLDRVKLTGLMDDPAGPPYWPGTRRPLLPACRVT